MIFPFCTAFSLAFFRKALTKGRKIADFPCEVEKSVVYLIIKLDDSMVLGLVPVPDFASQEGKR